MQKIIPVLAAVAVLSGCSGYAFHSNLSPENFREYYKPSGVTVLSDEEFAATAYKSKGLVSGLSCQAREQDPVATQSEARTQARIKAVDLNANGIHFKKCVKLENTPACLVSYTCYADALVIPED